VTTTTIAPIRIAEPRRIATVKCAGGSTPTLKSNPQATAAPSRMTSRISPTRAGITH
jgi:hypothetical protein